MGHTFTKKEESARAQSLGLTLLQFRSLSQSQRQEGASIVGTRGGRVSLVDDQLPPPFPPPPGPAGPRPLTFAQTEAGARLQASLARETERFSGRERLKLEDTLNALATELLPPEDVETAMLQVRRGEVVKSKLAFQAVLENLSDIERNTQRRLDFVLEEENEKRTLREARASITIDLIGRDLGRAILFALGAGD